MTESTTIPSAFSLGTATDAITSDRRLLTLTATRKPGQAADTHTFDDRVHIVVTPLI